jgi:hypothetical protein
MTDPAPLERAVEATGLAWSVRSSFVRYVSQVARGVVSVTGGAGRIADGRMHFPVRDVAVVDPDTASVRAAFAGSVRFVGHDGVIDLAIDDLEIDVDEGVGVLRSEGRDLVEVRVLETICAESLVVFRLASCLAAGAESLFGDVYSAGAAFDEVEVRVRAVLD